MLEKSDEKYIKSLSKKGWEIKEFNITSKGFELTMTKQGKETKFTEKNPELSLKKADAKLR